MKKYFTLLLSAALSLTAFAQQKKVAVYVTGEQSGISKVLGDQLVAAFAKSGKYIAVERTNDFLSEISTEHNYQRSGAVSVNEISRLGVQFEAQYVCVADISELFGEKYISARLIDAESVEVINHSNATSKLDNMQELLKVADNIAKELTEKTVQEKAEEALSMQQAYAEKEKELKIMLDQGYIEIANLYVTISYSKVDWKHARKISSQCNVGGMKKWRIPTVSEFNVAYKGIRQYQLEQDYYPNIKGQLKSIDIFHEFWTSDHTHGEYGGCRYEDDDYRPRFSYLMLVHNIE